MSIKVGGFYLWQVMFLRRVAGFSTDAGGVAEDEVGNIATKL